MKIEIIAIGKIKEDFLRNGMAEFIKRLKPYCTLVITEYQEEKMPENPSIAEKNKVIDKEGEKLLQAIKNHNYIIVLDIAGKMIASEDLAVLFETNALSGKSNVAIIIGGAYGLSASVKEKADMLWSFSRLTFTHQIIRFLLLEQIYRAFKIMNKEKYHN